MMKKREVRDAYGRIARGREISWAKPDSIS
jgi:hypothetical protein